MYKTDKVVRMAEVDDFEKGCLPESVTFMDIDISFTAQTVEEIIDKIKDFHGVTDDDMGLDACDETGRIDVHVVENADGMPASKEELDDWELGNQTLWHVIYTHRVYKCEPASLGGM